MSLSKPELGWRYKPNGVKGKGKKRAALLMWAWAGAEHTWYAAESTEPKGNTQSLFVRAVDHLTAPTVGTVLQLLSIPHNKCTVWCGPWPNVCAFLHHINGLTRWA